LQRVDAVVNRRRHLSASSLLTTDYATDCGVAAPLAINLSGPAHFLIAPRADGQSRVAERIVTKSRPWSFRGRARGARLCRKAKAWLNASVNPGKRRWTKGRLRLCGPPGGGFDTESGRSGGKDKTVPGRPTTGRCETRGRRRPFTYRSSCVRQHRWRGRDGALTLALGCNPDPGLVGQDCLVLHQIGHSQWSTPTGATTKT